MKAQLKTYVVVLALSGLVAVQSGAQSPNPHPAREALKELQPLIGTWTGEEEAAGGFEGLTKGRTVIFKNRCRWILKKTAIQITWNNKFNDDGKPFNFGTGIITLDPVSKNLHWSSFGYDGKIYWTGTGTGGFKDNALHFAVSENTINKTHTTYEMYWRLLDSTTCLLSHKNLVQNGKAIGDWKDLTLTKSPPKKKATGK